MLALKTGFEPMYFPWEVILKENELTSPLDAALTHVNPNRRRFLGLLLAGVAAAPLLTSVSLSADGQPTDQKAASKGGAPVKNAAAQKQLKAASPQVKSSGSKIKAPNPQATKQTKKA